MNKPIQLALMLFALIPAVNAYAEEPTEASDIEATPRQSSNIRSWEEDEQGDNWTWFGMGYESRHSFSKGKGATSPGSGGGAGPNKGSGHGGPGGKR